MITNHCERYGHASVDHFWIVCSSKEECMSELTQYAKKHPEQDILYIDCGTRPGHPVPVPENIFEVYVPDKMSGLLFMGWSVYQYGRPS